MDSSPEQNVYNVQPDDLAKKNEVNTPLHFNVILLGKTGDGKSATGNTILGKKAFESKRSSNSTTQEVQMERVIFDGVTLDVYDTPGLFDPEKNNKEMIKKCKPLLQLNPSAPLVFLLVIKADRFTPEEKKTVELVERMVPDWLLQNFWILFTRGDELESDGVTIEQFIEETEELKRVIQRFNNRKHVFNNRKHNPDQVKRLIEKIRKSPLNMAPERLPQTIPVYPQKDPTERRIVLLGKTGAVKSAVGNTILGETRFISEFSLSSVTAQCEMDEAVVAGRRVCVVDTPGLFDTEMSPEDLAVEIGRSVYLSSPGPHAFLYVQPINIRFTQQEEEVFGKLEQMFGEGMRKYTIILFTHGDQLEGKSVDNVIKKSKSVSRLVDQCGGYHVFNNNDQENRQQVTDLLEKIDRMLKKNVGSCYSNKMFEDAERCKMEKEETVNRKEDERQEEIEKIEKETEERVRGEIIKENIQKIMNEETEKKIREEVNKETQTKIKKEKRNIDIEIEKTIMEKLNKFLERNKKQLWTAGLVGAGYGAVSGFFLGLFGGACLGAGVGAVAGAGVGAVVGRWNYKKKEKFRIRKEMECEKNERYEKLEKKIEKEKKIAEEMERQKPKRDEEIRKELARKKKKREEEIVRKLEKMRVESEKIISEEMEKRKKENEGGNREMEDRKNEEIMEKKWRGDN